MSNPTPNSVNTTTASGMPEAAQTLHRIWWQLATLVIVSTAAVMAGMSFDEQMQKYLPEPRTQASIFNKKPSGLSGLMEIANSTGLVCRSWLLPYRQLTGISGMLVIVAPSESLAEFETEQILNWVKKGNDLVYLDHFGYKITRRLLQKIDVDTKEGDDIVEKELPVDANLPEFAHVKELKVSAATFLIGGQPLVSDKAGTLFTEVKHGKGRILIGTVPSLVSNRRLSEMEAWSNFQFVVNWLRTAHGGIWFDEKCHGFSQTSNVFIFLGKGAVGFAFFQGLLLLAVGIFSASQRFGKTSKLDDKRKISNLEFIFGLANAYRRARANTAVLEIIGQALKSKVCKLLSISPHESNIAISEAWKASAFASKPHADLVPQFFAEYDAALERKNISDHDLKALIATCDKITEQCKELFTTRSQASIPQDGKNA